MTDLMHNSALNRLRHCEQAYAYEYVDGLKPKQRLNAKMMLGSWVHALLAAQGIRQGLTQETLLVEPKTFDAGFDGHEEIPLSDLGDLADLPANVHDYLIDNVWDYVRGMDDEIDAIPERAYNLYKRYLARWTAEGSMNTDKVLAVEYQWQRDGYGGQVDRIVQREDGLVVVRDHKTTGAVPNADFRLRNTQLHLYAWGLAPFLHTFDLRADAVEYDYLYTYEPSVRFTKAGKFYKNQSPVDYLALREAVVERFEDDKQAMDDMFQSLEFHTLADEGNAKYFSRVLMPVNHTVISNILLETEILNSRRRELHDGLLPIRNTTRACDYCNYKALCTADYYGNDTTLLKDDYIVDAD